MNRFIDESDISNMKTTPNTLVGPNEPQVLWTMAEFLVGNFHAMTIPQSNHPVHFARYAKESFLL